MCRLLLVVLLITASLLAQSATVVEIDGITKPVLVDIQSMVVSLPPQCETKFCDSADTDCDGVLDDTCPGLTYNVCRDGSIVDSYMEAAFSGFCLQEPEECVPGELVLSPSLPCEP